MRYLIIGNGPGGNAAAAAARRCDPMGEVVILSDESYQSYYRPLLPLYMEDKVSTQTLFRDALHTPPGVTVRLNSSVKAINPQRQVVTLGDGSEMSYDRLLLAPGSSPAMPPVANLAGQGVFGLRTLKDADGLRQAARGAKKAVIIGGGRIGVKAALALRLLGLHVTVVEMLPRPIPLQLDEAAGEIVRRKLGEQGIALHLGESAREVERQQRSTWDRVLGRQREKGMVRGVVTDKGKHLEADLVVVAVGVRANTQLASTAGAKVRNGLLVDENLRTSLPNVYAAGDVVETVDLATGEPMVSGTWTNAVAMGHIAGENMAGGMARFRGGLNVYNAMEIAGYPVISAGVVNPGDGYQSYVNRQGDNYRKLVFRDNRLVGMLATGDAIACFGPYAALIRERTDVSKIKDQLIAGTFSYALNLTPKPALVDTYARR